MPLPHSSSVSSAATSASHTGCAAGLRPLTCHASRGAAQSARGTDQVRQLASSSSSTVRSNCDVRSVPGGSGSGCSSRRTLVIRRDGLQDAYEKAYTMSQIYSKDRPAPIPHEEHVRRRKQRDLQELIEAGRRKGKPDTVIREGLVALEALVPDPLNLHKMKAADWVGVVCDVPSVAARLIALKSFYPGADVHRIIAQRPRILLETPDRIAKDAEKVCSMVGGRVEVASQLVQLLPELADPAVLGKCLLYVTGMARTSDPVQVLLQHPELAREQGESNLELTADYGELSTKD